MAIMQGRRSFVTNAVVAGAAGFGALSAVNRLSGGKSLAAEPPPEITTIRLERDTVTCIAPQVVEELLRAEGFTDIRYVEPDRGARTQGRGRQCRRSFRLYYTR
jgi:NitT/TauT family transport system substrate-binding protein